MQIAINMLRKFKVLMWKHLIVRRRRFILTAVEMLSPLVLFIILFLNKDAVQPTSKYHNSSTEVFNTESISIAETNAPKIVFYTPDTPTTRSLMERVGRKLELAKLDTVTSERVKGYIAIRNTTGWNDSSIGKDNAFVKFQNMEESMPQKLNYTIRVMMPYATDDDLDDGNKSGQHRAYGTDYEPFLRLQWAIDSSYMESLTGNTIRQQVSLQEFPYASQVKNPGAKIIGPMIEFVCVLSLPLVFVLSASRLMEERITGLQEMIKMVGVSGALLNLCHILNVAPVGIIYSVVGTVLLKVSGTPMLPNTSPVLIWIMLVLHFMTILALAFFVSGILRSSQYAVSFSATMYISFWLLASFLREVSTTSIGMLCGLCPHIPILWFFIDVAEFEENGQGATFSNLTNRPATNALSTLGCIIFSILQIVMLSGIAWYLCQVNPGPFAQAQPWNFLFTEEYWKPKKVAPVIEEEELSAEDAADPRYFEQPRSDAEVGIKIVNVSKVFPKHRALNNVSLDVYKGEITVLLGHNGAGKTTLMSIITGMMSATNGKVYVKGLDTNKQKEQMRKHLGLCPQHNLFFSDLTVLEQVMFFTLLKGGTFAGAKESSIRLLVELGLAEKANNKSSELSGGMKRRLQLGCALAGKATVLVLDEPTSGLDVETRRQLWDLLLSLRGSRAVLLSTHFMEEADALGDRVAALSAGRLRCLASPMHLKRALGTGYRVTCTTVGRPNEAAISALVKSHVPDATVKEETVNGISYNLPSKNSKDFPKLFNELESKRSELGIDNIGVGVSTLEEVFLKLCSDVQTPTLAEEERDSGVVERVYPKLSGLRLCLRQYLVLFKRQFKYIWKSKISFLLMQVFFPWFGILGVSFLTNMEHEDKSPTNKTVAMNLDLFSKQPERRVLYTLNISDGSVAGVEKWYPDVAATITPNVPDTVLRIGLRDSLDYNKYLAGVEINDTDAKMLYTTVVRHAAPVAMNLLSNIVAASLKMRDADGHIITTYSHPLKNSHIPLNAKLVEPKDFFQVILWASVTIFIIIATIINAVALPCKERIAGSRHLHILAGALPELPWLAALTANTLIYTLILSVPTVVSVALIDKDSTLNQPDFLVALFITLFLGSMAFLSFTFLISLSFGQRASTVILVAVLFIFGFISPIFKAASKPGGFLFYLTSVLGAVMPTDAFVSAALRCSLIAYNNAVCVLNEGICSPRVEDDEIMLQQDKQRSWKCYFCFESLAPAPYMLVLLVQTIVIMLLVIQAERGTFKGIMDRLWNFRYKPVDKVSVDQTVRAEKEYVARTIALPKNKIPDALLVNNLHKNYPRLCRKSCNAVKGVSFSVKKGEIFGLLGVNGAGKSTIFKMLTGLEHPTRGSVYANGYQLNNAYIQYLRSLGYCPQFFGLDEFLTGSENLTLLLTLQGFSPADVATQAASWIETVGLQLYSNRVVSSYSGGCARRLAAAAALCGAGRVALLDEPSAGVDVAARRRLWLAVRRAAAQRAVIISSHSMDETEALCARIAIMCDGRVRALGTAGALRAAHAAGYAVQIRVAAPRGDVTDSAKSEMTQLKSRLQQTFNCTLKDEHETMLHYHVNERMRYSQLFADLEKLKEDFPNLIQDYSVAETTLEEVFLSFAGENNADRGPTPV